MRKEFLLEEFSQGLADKSVGWLFGMAMVVEERRAVLRPQEGQKIQISKAKLFSFVAHPLLGRVIQKVGINLILDREDHHRD